MHEPWFTRTFRFDYPVERLPVFLDRLRGTADRIEAKLRGVDRDTLTRRIGDTWSILENVGHLCDLEELHLSRLDELSRGATALKAADVENRATWDADHNAQTLASLMARFRSGRETLVRRLESWDPARLGDAAMHPRLKQPMRVVDVACFTAEHDDYHLARIHELLRLAGERTPADVTVSRWLDLPMDAPMPSLARRRVIGDMAMISHVTLEKGCVVGVHQHANEQVTAILRGRLRFTLAGGTRDVGPGEVVLFPANAPHGAEALEETEVLDVFSPPSATTGIDRR